MSASALKSSKLFHFTGLSSMYQRISRFASKLVYSEYGDPIKVIHKEKEDVLEPETKQVLIKMLAAPVNPADINTIQGKYPSKPPLPAVPGNEGVGVIEKVGPEVEGLCEGDHVVPLTNNLGTWRTHLVLPTNNILKVGEIVIETPHYSPLFI